MANIKVLIAIHKDYAFPKDDCYYPIQVGKTISHLDLGILDDEQGNNISHKNNSFCELTALYWAWKNNFFADSDYVGLVHYRRYFKGKELVLKGKQIAGESELLSMIKGFDCILPKKRNYYIETVYDHYKHAHYEHDLELTKQILEESYPDYLPAYHKLMSGKTLHLYNMFIMRTESVDKYCQWLFDILFELEKRVDIKNYDNYQKRVFGFIAERLFNIWLIHNQIKIKEIPVVSIESENLLLKGIGLIKRKFLRK
ncbi:uncharacterized protein DUF4422 [Mesocricetibacter intestinalis]|uniref:Uncharacterized protein DUF4422 n=1 Tax=Mesocricetibacter intestinalis TaxID=1521930 RepID=A0A4V3D9M6_9PAST|nr:DUF4422 domain-containing protein [Mesocricetibacter intestinalis]TDQ57887.1 uncharacterized protein DUF4422 [Mesocricetibacter intestinalis]